MIAGHFGLAAGIKGRERQVPLWALMLATVWLDIVFAPLLAAGVETIENVPGTSGGFGKAIIHAEWTHSLVGALALAALFGLWKAPAASVLVELALVIAGAWLYWRAAVQTSSADTRRANLLGVLLLAAGVMTLASDALVA